jgi:ribosomal protein S18 acetylase RimI-like enzyme
MDLTPYLDGDEEALLDLEFRASEPYTTFVFSSIDQALRVRHYLFARQLCEFSPPHAQLLRDAGRVVGLLATLEAAELTKCRLRAAHALTKSRFLEEDPGLPVRLHLAGQALLKLMPEDLYISRIAAHEAERGRGIGTDLLQCAAQEARARGCPRIALEVSPQSTAALRLYHREGFEQIDAREVNDPLTGRSLHYLHLAKTVS